MKFKFNSAIIISPIFLIILLTITIKTSLSSLTQSSKPSPQYHNKNIYKIQQHESINIVSSTNTKIILINNSNNIQSQLKSQSQKSHSISTSIHRGIVNDEQQENSYNSQWNITIVVKILSGNGKFYFAYYDGFRNQVDKLHLNLKQEQNQEIQWQNNVIYTREYLQIKQGINTINSKKLKPYLNKQPQQQKYLKGPFCIIAIIKQSTNFILYYGNPQYTINSIKIQQPTNIIINKDEINKKKVYLLNIYQQNQFNIEITRKKGFPSIYIYQCTTQNPDCYKINRIIPYSISKKPLQNKQYNIQLPKYSLQSMLTKSQTLYCQKCNKCNLYLIVQPNQLYQQQIQILIQSNNYIIQLKQNHIQNYDIKIQQIKKYIIKMQNQQNIKINIQVYQGQIQIQIKNYINNLLYKPIQTSGIITIQIPYENENKQINKDINTNNNNNNNNNKNNKIQQYNYNIQIKTKGDKDATYSIVYSSGQYQIFIKDGFPTTHQIKSKQNISFFYYNQDIKDTPIYLSFNLNNSKAQNSLKMHIYYYIYTQNKNKNKKIQYNLPIKSNQQHILQTKSILIQIPGKYPKLQVEFQNIYNQTIQIAITINDQQIIFLPLYYSLPLQIQKNGGVNLLINNNQEGFIQLTIKKCDQSYPNIAYSLSPQDFMKQIYDYQSLGQNQRIVKSNIKVKKGRGLYIRISGDGIANSFFQVTANYMQSQQKKSGSSNAIKKGNHGQINYQLITNSKAQIWFNQLQCSEECQKNTKYECFWSTSKSDLFRHMICPGIFLFGNNNQNQQKIKTQGYVIQTKPGRDGIISFKHILSDPIIYMSIKASNSALGTQLIYKDFEIVTISGQLGRMSTQFLFISIGTATFITIIVFFLITKQARLGYTAVNTSENQKKKKTKLDIIKSG